MCCRSESTCECTFLKKKTKDDLIRFSNNNAKGKRAFYCVWLIISRVQRLLLSFRGFYNTWFTKKAEKSCAVARLLVKPDQHFANLDCSSKLYCFSDWLEPIFRVPKIKDVYIFAANQQEQQQQPKASEKKSVQNSGRIVEQRSEVFSFEVGCSHRWWSSCLPFLSLSASPWNALASGRRLFQHMMRSCAVYS